MNIEINRRNGQVTVGEFKITARTRLDELPSYFQIGEEFLANVGEDKVPCAFATTTFEKENITTNIGLRFENKVLVSIFIEFTDNNKSYPGNEYYESTAERVALHLTWLKSKLGNKQSQFTTYKWGHAGVVEDKSAGVYIHISNKNNSWVS